MTSQKTPLLFTSLALAFGAFGCGDGDENNTTNPGVQIVCGVGTTLSFDGASCIATESVCGAGQVFDEDTRKCALDTDALCEAGTTFDADSNACVPTADVCAEGTTYDAGAGRCRPDVTCGEGTIVVEAACVPRGDIVNEDYIQEDVAENDPAFGGTPQALTLPGVADSVRVQGTIGAPGDRNQDNQLEQDLDVYSVELTAGDVIKVSALQLGSGSYGIEVRGPSGYYRQGPRYESEPSRSILALEDGTHTITVRPQATLFDPLAGPTGSPENEYLMVLENLGGLDLDAATDYDLANSSDFTSNWSAQKANVLKLAYPADTVIDLSLDDADDSVLPQFVLLDNAGKPTGTLKAGDRRALLSGGLSGSVWVMLDYIELGQDTDYTLRTSLPSTIELSGALRAGGEQTKVTTETVRPGGEVYIAVRVEQQDVGGQPTPRGQIVRMELTALNSMLETELEVYGPNNQLIKQNAGLRSTFYAAEEGTYLVRVKNEDEAIQQGVNQVRFESEAPSDLGQLTSGGSVSGNATLDADSYAYFVFDAAAPLSVDIDASATGELNLSYYTEDLQVVANAQSSAPSLEDMLAERAGPRVLLVSNLSGAQLMAAVTVTSSGEPTNEVEPNDRPATAQRIALEELVAGSLSATDEDTFVFTPTQAGLFQASARSQGTSTLVRATLRNERLEVIARSLPSAGAATAGGVLRANETYYVTVSSPVQVSSDTDYSLLLKQLPVTGEVGIEPNEDAVDAQAITATGGVWQVNGTVEGLADEDWYALNLASAKVLTLGLEDALLGDPAGISLEVVAIAADGSTELRSDGLIFAPAGTTFVRVRSLNNRGEGNSYRLKVVEVTSTALGALSTSALDTSGTLNANGEAIYSFTVGTSITSTPTRRPVVWSDKRVDVYAGDGTQVHESIDSGQFFSSEADSSFSPDTLAAGTYHVLVSGRPNAAFRLVTGDLSGAAELPGNEMLTSAPDAGALTVGAETVYFGTVDDVDNRDYMKVTIPDVGGANQTIYLEHYQLGTSVADLDLALYDDTFFPAGNAVETPQVLELTLAPGDYIIEVLFVDDVTMMASGDYALRVGLR